MHFLALVSCSGANSGSIVAWYSQPYLPRKLDEVTAANVGKVFMMGIQLQLDERSLETTDSVEMERRLVQSKIQLTLLFFNS